MPVSVTSAVITPSSMTRPSFTVVRKPVRKAGQKVPNLMTWVQLRQEGPVVRKMLEKVDVYQQPSGFVDNIISSWIAKSQAQWCTGSVEQRDLFASSISENG